MFLILAKETCDFQFSVDDLLKINFTEKTKNNQTVNQITENSNIGGGGALKINFMLQMMQNFVFDQIKSMYRIIS